MAKFSTIISRRLQQTETELYEVIARFHGLDARDLIQLGSYLNQQQFSICMAFIRPDTLNPLARLPELLRQEMREQVDYFLRGVRASPTENEVTDVHQLFTFPQEEWVNTNALVLRPYALLHERLKVHLNQEYIRFLIGGLLVPQTL